MQKKSLFIFSAIAMFALGVAMVIIGVDQNMIPPLLTGIGFVIIATVFMYLGRALR